ncbi:two-component system OmpR family response regulator [Paraburkholderia sp. GAS33]|jgi:two-component system OmpR family response regulator|uniref:response regulator transcription factor n=1 Tax=unclassified Paraburkholderia TaxID=2615204 RepID=UPI003D21D4BF
MRILLVSSSEAETVYLHKAFRESAHSVQAADNLRYALYLASHEEFDAIVISAVGVTLMTSLFDALPELARLPRAPAVIVALASGSSQDRARVLRAGADACFVQPYSFLEMQERMLALHRASVARSAQPSATLIQLRLDPLTRDLVEDGKRVLMTKREYLLIECLLRQVNAPVARDQLIRYAWPDKEDVDPSSVNLVVSRLRRKLELNEFRARVETISRYGYQLASR